MATHSSVLAWRIPGTGGAWWGAVYGVAQSRTRLKRLSSSSSRVVEHALAVDHIPALPNVGVAGLTLVIQVPPL